MMRSSAILPSPRFERYWSVIDAESLDRKTRSLKRDHERSLVELGVSPVSTSSSSPFLQLNHRKEHPVRMDGQVEEGQSGLAVPRQAVTDDEGNTVTLSLDIKSVKPYRTQDEYLYAMKEDLAEWFNALYDLPITVDDFFEQLETGIVLCQHANALQNFIARQLTDEKGSPRDVHGLSSSNHRYPVQLPSSAVVFRSRVQPGSFQSRDNISNFIAWCRQVLGIPNTLLFETEDLVSRKNERNVVLCVLEVARRGASYGMLAPKLVQFEAEIDAEMAQDAEEEAQNDGGKNDCNQNQHQQPTSQTTASSKKKPWIEVDMMSLDEMVRLILSACTCEHQFPMVRVSEGKYRYGDSLSLIFLRILRNHVMVRIGGGWDTLECFLDRYDPCRCKSKEHRGMLAFATKTQSSHSTDQHKALATATISQAISSCPSQHSTADTTCTTQPKDSPSLWTKGSPQKHPSKETLQPEKQSKPRGQEQPHPPLKPKPQSPLHTTKSPDYRTGPVPRRTPSPVPLSITGGGQPAKSQGSQGNRLNGPVKPSVAKRLDITPSSASPSLARANKTFRSSGDLLSSGNRGNSPARGQSPSNRQSLTRTGSSSTVLDTGKNSAGVKSVYGVGRVTSSSRPVTSSVPRSRSMDSTKLISELRQQKPKPAAVVSSSTGQRPLSSVSRTKSSPNVVLSKSNADKQNATRNSAQLTRASSQSSGNLTQKLNGLRLSITTEKLLPSYSQRRTDYVRSSSLDVPPVDEARVSPGGAEESDDDDDEEHPSRMRRSASLQPSVSFTLLHIDDYPEVAPPPEDEDLNARMEMLFEQYRDVELGQMSTVVSDKTDKNQSDKKTSGSGTTVSSKKNSTATPSSSSKALQGRCRSRERVDSATPPSSTPFRRAGVVDKGDKQRSVRTLCPSAKTPSDEKASRSSYRPASSSLLERGNRMVSRKESNSWSADQSQQTPRGPGSDGRMRSSFDASLRSTGDARPRSSSRPRNFVSKERGLSESRESFSVGGSLGRRKNAPGLSKSFGDISDIPLTLQRPLTGNPASRTSGIETSCGENIPGQMPLNGWKEGSDADNLKMSLDLVGDGAKAKPRKDDRLGPPTRIPLPVAPGDQRQHDHSIGGSLKRFDSGVDITNISPTGDNGSIQGDEDGGSCRGWTISVQCPEARSLSENKLMFTAPPQGEDEFY